MLKVTKHIE